MFKDITRPERGVIEFFKTVPSAVISDVTKKMGMKPEHLFMEDVLPQVPVAPDVHIAGPAVTMKMAPHSATFSHLDFPEKLGVKRHFEIVESVSRPGDVVVIDVGQQHIKFNVWGEHMSLLAKQMGLAGMVTDSYIRDMQAQLKIQFPLFAKGRSMLSYVTYVNPVAANIPVQCGGAFVKPGDIVVGDIDGVVVVPTEKLDEIMKEAKHHMEVEAEEVKLINEGKFKAHDMYEWAHRQRYGKV